MRHPTVLRSVLQALQLRGLVGEGHDRGFGAGIEDLPAQCRLALAVLHDRRVLRERLHKARDVGAEALVQLSRRDVGVLEHVVQQTRNDQRRRLTVGGEQLADGDRMLDRLARTPQTRPVGVREKDAYWVVSRFWGDRHRTFSLSTSCGHPTGCNRAPSPCSPGAGGSCEIVGT
jgi:hypothetical protein